MGIWRSRRDGARANGFAGGGEFDDICVDADGRGGPKTRVFGGGGIWIRRERNASSGASSGTGLYINTSIYIFVYENIILYGYTGRCYDVDLNPNWGLEARGGG